MKERKKDIKKKERKKESMKKKKQRLHFREKHAKTLLDRKERTLIQYLRKLHQQAGTRAGTSVASIIEDRSVSV